MGHGAADPLVAAVLLDVGNPLLTLRHDLCALQVEVLVDHLREKKNTETRKRSNTTKTSDGSSTEGKSRVAQQHLQKITL